MTDRTDPAAPPSPHPLGADAPHEDYVGLAFGALGFSIALGVALNAIVAFTVRTLQAGRPPATDLDLTSGPAVTLLLGTLLACLTSAVATWRLLAPAGSPYRQGMLAMVSFFGSFVVSMVTRPVDARFGRPGLVVLALVAFALVVAVGRRLPRQAAAP